MENQPPPVVFNEDLAAEMQPKRVDETNLTKIDEEGIEKKQRKKRKKRNEIQPLLKTLPVSNLLAQQSVFGKIKADFTHTRYKVLLHCAEDMEWKVLDDSRKRKLEFQDEAYS